MNGDDVDLVSADRKLQQKKEELDEVVEKFGHSEVKEELDELQGELDRISEEISEADSYNEDLESAVAQSYMEMAADLEDIADRLDETDPRVDIHLNQNSDSFVGGDLVVEYQNTDTLGGFIESLKGPGMGVWFYDRSKIGLQKLENAYRGAREQEPLETDEPIDINRRRFLGEAAGLAALIGLDYSNFWVDDQSCGDAWIRLFSEPSGDVDGFGYGADQAQCHPGPAGSGAADQRGGEERILFANTEKADASLSAFKTIYTQGLDRQEKGQIRLKPGLFERYTDGEEIELEEAEFYLNPTDNPEDSVANYTLSNETGERRKFGTSRAEDSIVEKFTGYSSWRNNNPGSTAEGYVQQALGGG